jgi:transcriptional regulator with XRE-family HTH domain
MIKFEKKKIAVLIFRSGLKSASFARKVGISKQVLSHYLTGKHQPGVAKLCRIANEFDVDINFFFSGIEK